MKNFEEWKKEHGDGSHNYDTVNDIDDAQLSDTSSDNDKIEEPINDKNCNEETTPNNQDTLDFSTWVEKTECFGQNDLNDLSYVYDKLRKAYEYLFDGDWDAEFDVNTDNNGNIIISIKSGEEGKEKLMDILRGFWEDEMDQEENDLVAEYTIETLGL